MMHCWSQGWQLKSELSVIEITQCVIYVLRCLHCTGDTLKVNKALAFIYSTNVLFWYLSNFYKFSPTSIQPFGDNRPQTFTESLIQRVSFLILQFSHKIESRLISWDSIKLYSYTWSLRTLYQVVGKKQVVICVITDSMWDQVLSGTFM